MKLGNQQVMLTIDLKEIVLAPDPPYYYGFASHLLSPVPNPEPVKSDLKLSSQQGWSCHCCHWKQLAMRGTPVMAGAPHETHMPTAHSRVQAGETCRRSQT